MAFNPAHPAPGGNSGAEFSLMVFQDHFFLTQNSSGFSPVHYREIGPAAGRVTLCVHGLTGSGYDFDPLAAALAAAGARVISVDMPGRGQSAFLTNPADYCYRQYLHDLTALLAHLGVTPGQTVDWVGTSMGGLLGMRMAALPGTPVGRLILNDIGPHVPETDLNLIRGWIKTPLYFENFAQLYAFMVETRKPNFGPMLDHHWDHIAKYYGRTLDDGRMTFHYDPAIYTMFDREPLGELDMWAAWDSIRVPVFVIRGGHSTIFPQTVLDCMKTRGPGAMGLMDHDIWPGCGHVPSLMHPDQIEKITRWLAKNNKNSTTLVKAS